MKRTVRNVALPLTLAAALIAGGSLYLVSYALRPDEAIEAKRATAWEDVLAAYPAIRPWADSIRRTGALRDTTIMGSEGVRLHAYYLPAAVATDKTAVLVHGYTDSAERMMMIGYLYHHDLGFNILLPDLRYHGRSGGRAVGMGWSDRLDVLRWMEAADSLFGGRTRMVVHGISMGAATTMMVAGEEQPPYVKCYVEDCGYTSVRDQFAKELCEQFHLPAFPLLDVAGWITGLRFGWTFREASALRQVGKSRLPMLFIHGAEDDYVPTRMVYELYDAKPGEKELWVVPGAGHALSYSVSPDEYARRVAAFVGRYIP